jgi:cyanophycinase-like exopeptidase
MKTLVILVCTLCLAVSAHAGKQYSYFRVGNTSDVTGSTTAGTVLMGGGTDVDAAFQWMCQRSGNGDFLVIRASGTDAYNPYIRALCPNGNSVATLIIPNRTAASDPFVSSTIQKAEALWIAGGDQSDYINFWKGTPVETEINNVIARHAPIGRYQRRHERAFSVCIFGSGESGRDFQSIARRSLQSLHYAGSRLREPHHPAGSH